MAEHSLELELYNLQQARIVVKERLFPFMGAWLTAGNNRQFGKDGEVKGLDGWLHQGRTQ